MSPANGHANGAAVSQSSQTTGPLAAADVLDVPATPPFASQKVQELFKELAVPFDPSVIEWRVTNATTRRQERSGRTTTMRVRAQKRRLSSGLAPALAWVGTCTTSQECGSTSTSERDLRAFPSRSAGRHRRVGVRA